MNLKGFVEDSLNNGHAGLLRVLEGLTREEFLFQPTPESNHIWFVVFHLARTEEVYLNNYVSRAGEVWESQGWYKKFGLPLKDQGSGYTAEQMRSLPAPELSEFLKYVEAARQNTLKYLRQLSPQALNQPREPLPDSIFARGRRSLTGWQGLRGIIFHEAHHQGQIDYLRGLARVALKTTSTR